MVQPRKSDGFKWSLKSSGGGADLAAGAAVPDKFLPGEPSPGARGARPEHHQQPHHDGYQAHPPQEPHHACRLHVWHRPNMQPAPAPWYRFTKNVFFSSA